MSDAKGVEEGGESQKKKVQWIAGKWENRRRKWEEDKYKQVRITNAGNGIDGRQDKKRVKKEQHFHPTLS